MQPLSLYALSALIVSPINSQGDISISQPDLPLATDSHSFLLPPRMHALECQTEVLKPHSYIS